MTEIHQAHGSVSDFAGKDTSDYRIRMKTVNPGRPDAKTVYEVDGKLKQMWLKTLHAVGLKEEPKYLKAHELTDHLVGTEINFKTIQAPKEKQQNKSDFVLATIALKKELTTADDPEAVLEKYSDAVKHQVLQELLQKKSSTPEEIKSLEQAEGLSRLEEEYTPINADTGKTWKEEFKAKSYNDLLIVEYGKSVNFETGKEDLRKAANRIAEDPKGALALYDDGVKQKLLSKIENPNTLYIVKLCRLENGSNTEKLQALMDHGIDMKTGKVSDLEKLKGKLFEHRMEREKNVYHPGESEGPKQRGGRVQKSVETDMANFTMTRAYAKADLVEPTTLKELFEKQIPRPIPQKPAEQQPKKIGPTEPPPEEVSSSKKELKNQFLNASLDDRTEILKGIITKATAASKKEKEQLMTLGKELFGALQIENEAAIMNKVFSETKPKDPLRIAFGSLTPHKNQEKLFPEMQRQKEAARRDQEQIGLDDESSFEDISSDETSESEKS